MRDIVMRGLKRGIAMTAAETAVVLVSSSLESGSPWAGVNVLASAVGAGGKNPPKRFRSDVTPIGLSLHVGHLLAYGIAYEGLLSATRNRGNFFTALAAGLGGVLFDRYVLPERVPVNFVRRMGFLGTLTKYVALALASAPPPRRLGTGIRGLSDRVSQATRKYRLTEEQALAG